MALFEPFRNRPEAADALPGLQDLRLRPAVLGDVAELSQIEAAREGGQATQYASGLERAIASAATTGRWLILVAEQEEVLLGVGKVGYFAPGDDAPANIAPPGWYLSGVIVVPEYRRRGIGRRLTQARLDWIRERDCCAFYVANNRNRVTIELHREFGFAEVTRDFIFPGMTFEGGIGVLFRAALACDREIGGPTGDSTRQRAGTG